MHVHIILLVSYRHENRGIHFYLFQTVNALHKNCCRCPQIKRGQIARREKKKIESLIK